MPARAGHTKSGSSGFLVAQESNFNRQQADEDDPEFIRPTPGPAKPLWDPNNDDPTTRRTARRDRQSGHVNKPSENDLLPSITAISRHLIPLAMIYQDKPYNRPMQNVPKTISPKDALLDFDDAEEDAMTSLFPQNTMREEPMTSGVGGPSRKVGALLAKSPLVYRGQRPSRGRKEKNEKD